MAMDLSALEFQGDNGRDEFRREPVAGKIIQLLISDIHVSPMVIDGQWGMGKTEFCHKLINKFRSDHKEFRLLYVDAFQADHADNPLMTILSAVLTLLPEGNEKKTFLKKALPVLRFGLTTTGKAIASHVLKQNADDIADDLEKHLQDVADKAIDASVMTLLKDHAKANENITALQETLVNLAKAHPIVIFVDELDRCRPDFAVQMLEVIKHTLEVEGVQFVLITNTQQLRASINHCYGHQVDAQRYLDKFIKFSFQLSAFVPHPQVYDKQRKLAAVEHFSTLVKKSTSLSVTDIAEHQNTVCRFTHNLIAINNLSLREVETFARHLEIYCHLGKGLNKNIIFGYQLVYVFGVYVFCFSPEIVEAIQQNKSDAQQIAILLGVHKLPDFEAGTYRPSPTDVIGMLLTQASTFNSELYRLPESAQQFLNKRINSYFTEGGYELDQFHDHEAFDQIKKAITTLSLGEIC
ncbi:ATPase AAA [Aeromonas caviae]|uniref:KAP family P-loop NTPase fold protein n=1 Tax=Aeromonas caviae TaxID=648 RepID=UPI001CC645BE|nr:P-loop NTPase fold protein [Aeromonas caviae]BDA18528.1 ATPase AAA [Aeromonas caviae]